MRQLNKIEPGKPGKIEPYCGYCRVDLFTGASYCDCGWTYEERLASKWKLDGSNPKEKGNDAIPDQT